MLAEWIFGFLLCDTFGKVQSRNMREVQLDVSVGVEQICRRTAANVLQQGGERWRNSGSSLGISACFLRTPSAS